MLILLTSDSRQPKMLKKLFLIQVVTNYVNHSLVILSEQINLFHCRLSLSTRFSDFLTTETTILTSNMERSKAHLDNALPEMVRELGYQVLN